MLKGKKIIIVGGGGLIGRSLTMAVLGNGASVIVASRTASDTNFTDLDETRQNIGFAQVDITNPESVRRLFDETDSRFGKIDAVVNCSFPRNENFGAKFEDVVFEDFCDNVNSHLGGAFLVCQKAVDYFSGKGEGNIINFSSIYGVMAPRFELYDDINMTKEIEYIVCKSAIIRLTEYVAKYVKGLNIRVNCISPGGIANDQPAALVERYNEHCLNKAMLDGDDNTGTVVFLPLE